MTQLDDGGYAFPIPSGPEQGDGYREFGMTLRDWFAGRAMEGLIHDIVIDQHCEDVLLKQGMTSKEFPTFLAHLSYLAADAMIAQRKKPPS